MPFMNKVLSRCPAIIVDGRINVGDKNFFKPYTLLFLLTDACRPALWVDALKKRRALCERSELARPPVTSICLN